MPSPTELSVPRPAWKTFVHRKLLGCHRAAEINEVPAVSMFRWADNGDGTYTPVAQLQHAWMRVGDVEEFHIGGLTTEVMTKLVNGGFIIACQPAPSLTLFNVSDLLRHREEASEDASFWTRERLQRYKEGHDRLAWFGEPIKDAMPVDAGKVPALGILEMHLRAGRIIPEVRISEIWMRVSEAERLPLGCSAEILFRLVQGAFVIGTKAAPHSTMIDLSSLLDHFQETSEDLNYWTPERRERYAQGM